MAEYDEDNMWDGEEFGEVSFGCANVGSFGRRYDGSIFFR